MYDSTLLVSPMPTRLQRRWAPRFRTAGALLLLVGGVAIVDLLLPRGADPLGGTPLGAQLAAGVTALIVGGVSFALGRRLSGK